MKVLVFSALLLGVAHVASGHMSIISPCPRYSSAGTSCPKLPSGVTSLDSNANAPIGTHGGIAQPLCKFKTPWPTVAATWTAGQSVTIKFNPVGVSHSGGHCEFSMSYDGGKTFAVIHRELQYCFVGKKPSGTTNEVSVSSYTFDLPKDLPSSDKAIFAWSWVNASGNREFYMNCADVAIKGGSSNSYTGTEMVIANYGDFPLINEFNGNYENGMDLYKNAKRITVSPSGAKSSGGNVVEPSEEEEVVSPPRGKILAPRDVEGEKCDPEVTEQEGGGNSEDNPEDNPEGDSEGESEGDSEGVSEGDSEEEKCDDEDSSESNSSDETPDEEEQCDPEGDDTSDPTSEPTPTSESSNSSDDLGEQCEPEDSTPTSTTSTPTSESPTPTSESPTPTSTSTTSTSTSSTTTSEPTTTPAPVVNSNEPGLICQRPTGVSSPTSASSPTSSSPSSSSSAPSDSDAYEKFEISMPGFEGS